VKEATKKLLDSSPLFACLLPFASKWKEQSSKTIRKKASCFEGAARFL